MPEDYVVMTIEVPDAVPVRRGGWEVALDYNGRNPVWIVPSVIVPSELNVVLYPEARGYQADIKETTPFQIDSRLLRKQVQ